MVDSGGTRIGWADLPGTVRAAVEEILGGPVVDAVSQAGGFSPGTADRVRTADGRRAFVKAVGTGLNADSVALHRREARITAALPADVPAPGLLGVHDDGDWVALVLADVDGHPPATPWRTDELSAVLAMLGTLARAPVPPTLRDLPDLTVSMGEDWRGWRRLAADPPADLDPWARAHLDRLCDLEARVPAALAGDRLVHADVRADNLLIRPSGVVLVDWPWAGRGPGWFDLVSLLVNVRLHGGHDVEGLLAAHAPADAEPGDVTAVLAGLAGYFVDHARRPPPPGIPTVRAFQAAQGRAVLPWVRHRDEGA